MRRIAIIALALASISSTAQAHHARTMFDINHVVEIVGEVQRFHWTNPHCYVQVRVTDTSGAQQEYTVEMGAPLHLQENGWTPRTLRVGDRVRVTLHPLRSGDPGGELASITSLDGRQLGVTS